MATLVSPTPDVMMVDVDTTNHCTSYVTGCVNGGVEGTPLGYTGFEKTGVSMDMGNPPVPTTLAAEFVSGQMPFVMMRFAVSAMYSIMLISVGSKHTYCTEIPGGGGGVCEDGNGVGRGVIEKVSLVRRGVGMGERDSERDCVGE